MVRESADSHFLQYPRPFDIVLIVEVSNTSLNSDKDEKLPIYAADSIPV